MTLNELQRIKQWHVAHKADHPLEYHLWDLVLTVWMLGWVGWFPIIAFWRAVDCAAVPDGYLRAQPLCHLANACTPAPHPAVRLDRCAELMVATDGGWAYCRAVRTLRGRPCGWLVRSGLMSSPPRRV